MLCSLLGAYWFPYAKGFYLCKMGDERLDSSLLGVHWSVEAHEEEGMLYNILSFDVLYLSLLRRTIEDFFNNKEEEE